MRAKRVRVERQVKTKTELRHAHGTPVQFAKAIWKAHADLFITTTEAQIAINHYKVEYDNAPD